MHVEAGEHPSLGHPQEHCSRPLRLCPQQGQLWVLLSPVSQHWDPSSCLCVWLFKRALGARLSCSQGWRPMIPFPLSWQLWGRESSWIFRSDERKRTVKMPGGLFWPREVAQWAKVHTQVDSQSSLSRTHSRGREVTPESCPRTSTHVWPLMCHASSEHMLELVPRAQSWCEIQQGS